MKISSDRGTIRVEDIQDCVQAGNGEDGPFSCCIYLDYNEVEKIRAAMKRAEKAERYIDGVALKFDFNWIIKSAIESAAYYNGKVCDEDMRLWAARLRRLADICDQMPRITLDPDGKVDDSEAKPVSGVNTWLAADPPFPDDL